MDFLVIDDDKTFRDATCLLIDGEGHYAEAACSGAMGLTELKEGKFDAVLLDLNLGAENVPAGFTAQGNSGVLSRELTIRRGDFAIGEGPWAAFDIVANDVQVNFKLAVAAR